MNYLNQLLRQLMLQEQVGLILELVLMVRLNLVWVENGNTHKNAAGFEVNSFNKIFE